MLIDPAGMMSVYRQCELLDFNRSSFYYQPVRADAQNEQLMRLIDQQYTKAPFYGRPKMTAWLQLLGHRVNHKRVGRLMQEMGIQAIFPRRNLSKANRNDTKYPYLLTGLEITRPNQVWCADITYVRLNQGFVYLVAIMDWYSRYVVSWQLSNTLDADFCLASLEQALTMHKPEIFNTDQGVQFTSQDFTARLQSADIRVSMDSRGRAYDNIFVERLWRSVKYEEVYLHDYQSVPEAKSQLGTYFRFYNTERLHQSLGYKTPEVIYHGQAIS